MVGISPPHAFRSFYTRDSHYPRRESQTRCASPSSCESQPRAELHVSRQGSRLWLCLGRRLRSRWRRSLADPAPLRSVAARRARCAALVRGTCQATCCAQTGQLSTSFAWTACADSFGGLSVGASARGAAPPVLTVQRADGRSPSSRHRPCMHCDHRLSHRWWWSPF